MLPELCALKTARAMHLLCDAIRYRHVSGAVMPHALPCQKCLSSAPPGSTCLSSFIPHLLLLQVHGGAGVCDDFPLAALWSGARTLRLADGPDDVHLVSIAKLELAKLSKL